ncbi:hypothetical protein, partial [Salmonella enterica]|uniref:hypothetical protein n=1 Tax=Salmonella enterica TaxID=28901 RepID=UPI003CF0B6B3
QRVIALLREAGYDEVVYIHGAMQRLVDLYERHGVRLGPLAPATVAGRGDRQDFAGRIVVAPPSALQDRWARRFPDPLPAYIMR